MNGSGWEQISFMVDSGASETVAHEGAFNNIPITETTATGTQYSSACSGGPVITNAGEKVVEVMDNNAAIWHMKVQMCTNLNEKKFLASVSRINQAGQRVVFDTPEFGSYIENKKTLAKTWLRQESGVFYLDLWIKPGSGFTRQGMTR